MTRFAPALALAALSLCVAPADAQVAPPSPAPACHFPPETALRTMLRYIVEDSAAPGVVLGVLEPDGRRTVVAWGSGGPGAGPLGGRTLFEIGSVTKTFTATVLADMVLRGEIALDDPVSKFLPDSLRALAWDDAHPVTLEQLATHTAGLPEMGHRPASVYDPWADFTVEKLYAFVDTVRLRSVPGHRYNYSNIGMILLGHVLGRAAETDFATLVRERILAPLGMDRTTFTPADLAAPDVARAHDERGVIAHRSRTPAGYGAGGLYSDAEDLLKYLAAQVGPPRSELERAMRLAQQVRGTTVDLRYGLGWHISGLGSHTIVWHGGAPGGATATIAFDPEARTGTVVLADVDGFASDLALSLLPPDPPPPSWAPVRVVPETLTRYTGSYRATTGTATYAVRLDDEGALTYQPRGLPRARLYARTDSTFYLLRGPWSFTFRPLAGGGMALHMETDARDTTAHLVRDAERSSDQTPPVVAFAGGSWYHPPRGPGLAGALALAGLVLVVILMGPVRARRRLRE